MTKNSNVIVIDINKLPKMVKDAFKCAKTVAPDLDDNALLNIILAIISFITACKRIKVDEFANGTNIIGCNYFGIVFAPSGSGKDKATKYLKSKVFKKTFDAIYQRVNTEYNNKILDIQARYKDAKTSEEKKQMQAEIDSVRKVSLITSKCTQEGFYADAKALVNMQFGALFVNDSEIGLTLSSKDEAKRAAIDVLMLAFDNVVHAKKIKSDNSETENIENITVIALLMSDVNAFKNNKAHDILETLLITGMARRSIITYQDSMIKTIKDIDIEYKERQQAYNDAELLSDKIYKIYSDIEINSIYKLPESVAKDVIGCYTQDIAKRFNNCKNELLGKEMLSREFKIIKLSGVCAAINHPKNLMITKEDAEQAIYMVDILSNDFVKYIHKNSPYNDVISRIYDFLLDNLNKTFSKTELTMQHFSDFGISRRQFRKDFDDIMVSVVEYADLNGYNLIATPDGELNGTSIQKYSIKMQKRMTPEYLEELNKALSVDTI